MSDVLIRRIDGELQKPTGPITSEERSEYHRNYYKERKREISEARRKKYAEDAEYRKDQQKKSLEYYDKYKRKADTKGYSVKRAGGQELFTIKYAAKNIGYTPVYLRSLETRGIIPPTVYTDARGWRFYTKDQISLLITAFNERRSGAWGWEEVRAYLYKQWMRAVPKTQ